MESGTRERTLPSGPARPRYARRSLLMLAAFVGAYIVASIIDMLAMRAVGLQEGDLLLMDHSAFAWAMSILELVIMAVPVVLGVWFAVTALRRDGKGLAWLGLALNLALLVFVAYTFADQVQMSYRG